MLLNQKSITSTGRVGALRDALPIRAPGGDGLMCFMRVLSRRPLVYTLASLLVLLAYLRGQLPWDRIS